MFERFPGNRDMKVVRLSAIRIGRICPPPTRKSSGYPFLLRAIWKDYVTDKFHGTIGNRTRDLVACSAVPQATAPPRAETVTCSYIVVSLDGFMVHDIVHNLMVQCFKIEQLTHIIERRIWN